MLTLVEGPGRYRGWYTTDGLLWDYKANATAHQRYLNLKALLDSCGEDHRVFSRDVQSALRITVNE